MSKEILQTESTDQETGGTSKPRVRIDLGEPLHLNVRAAIAALAAGNDEREPEVMVRDNTLVRMTERGELEPLVRDSLLVLLSEAAQFERRGEDGEPRPVDPPTLIANSVLAQDAASYAELPRVDRVVDVPVLGVDNRLITEAGYDEANRLYYQPAEGLEGVAPRPVDDTESLDWALNMLCVELLGDFDFQDEADHERGSSLAHALSLVLVPFVRERIEKGSTPLHVVLAPDVGSGKTWLAQACLIPGCGYVAATPPTASDEEWRKRITAFLLRGNPAVLLDNLSGTLDTGALAAALTADTWSDRILGESKEVALSVRNVWVVTGNNLKLSPEMTRRSVASFLEAAEDSDKASDRDRKEFRHPNLLAWAQENRRALVEAVLTLIEHWRQGPFGIEGGYAIRRTGEAPTESALTKGSYERWAAVVGGILESSGVGGFLGNEDRLKSEADQESKEGREFLAELHSLIEDEGRPLPMKEIEPHARFGGRLSDVLPEEPASASPARLNRALTTWLTQNRNRNIGGYVARSKKLGGKGNKTGWYVQRKRISD